MNDKVQNQSVERKTSILTTIKNKHQENLKACDEAFKDTPYHDECKKAAAKVMHEDMLDALRR